MSREHTGITLAPKKTTLRKVIWGLAFLALIVWAIKNPYQASDAVRTVAHSVSVFISGLGDH
jgi:hypothetical protein